MSSLGYDAQSLQHDGRRLWLASTSIACDQIPVSRWQKTLLQIRLTGFNCIDVRLPWALHEPKPGRFHFTGQADIRQFIQIARELGLWCILRPGPCIRQDWPRHGLPGWLTDSPATKMRQADPAWLEACARYLGNVMDQVRDLQATAPAATHAKGETANPFDAGPQPAGGIVLIQAEHQWLCHHPAQGQAYLSEIVRYLRQNGCEVPITCSNNLWQAAEGTFHTWRANEHLATDLRQLAMVQPQAPRMISDLHPNVTAPELARRLACVLGTGGQFNLTGLDEHWLNPNQPVDDDAASLLSLGPLLSFASQFGHVLAHALPAAAQATLSPDGDQPGFTLLQQQGQQGRVIFIIRTGADDKTDYAPLLLPDGQTLPIPMGDESIAWAGMDINLTGLATLTLTNLRPTHWLHRQMLVLAGPAGYDGLVSINDSPLTITVPDEGHKPIAAIHEGITVVVLNTAQARAAFPCASGLAIGAQSLDETFSPVAKGKAGEAWVIDPEGKISKLRRGRQGKSAATVPTLTSWAVADALSWQQVDAGQPLEKPTSLEALDNPLPWGWYHVALPAGSARTRTLACPATDSGLLLYSGGKHRMTLEPGRIIKGKLAREMFVLAASAPHSDEHWQPPLPTGLAGDLLALKPVRLPLPERKMQPIADPLSFAGYLPHYRQQARPMATTCHWNFKATGRQSFVLQLTDLPGRAMISLNGRIIFITHSPAQMVSSLCTLDQQAGLQSGKNLLELSWLQEDTHLDMPPGESLMKHHVSLHEATPLTAEAQITFLPWSLPPAQAWKDKLPAGHDGPSWHRCRFKTDADTGPLNLRTAELSQGCAYLNGQLIGCYDNTTLPDAPAQRITLPQEAMNDQGTQELVLFGVHAGRFGRCLLERVE